MRRIITVIAVGLALMVGTLPNALALTTSSKYRVSIAVDKSTIMLGSLVRITGKVSPSAVGKRVTIQKKLAGGKWKTAKEVKVKSDRTFDFVDKPKAAGNRQYRAYKPKRGKIKKGYSGAVTVKVVKPISAAVAANLLIPAGTCGGPEKGWNQKYPIQLKGGVGDAVDRSGVGAGIMDSYLVGGVDVTGDGIKEMVVSLRCMGSTLEGCCAGRLSNTNFIAAFDLTTSKPRRVGATIMPFDVLAPSGDSEPRDIYRPVRLEGKQIVTFQQLVYPESYSSAQLATMEREVRYEFRKNAWVVS